MARSSSVSPETTKKWQKRAAILAAIAALLTICGALAPLGCDVLMSKRDKEILKLTAAVEAQAQEINELKGIVKESLQATKTRFSQNEENVRYLREAVVAIRTEMDIRFNKDHITPVPLASRAPASIPAESAGSSQIKPEVKALALKRLAQRANTSLQQSGIAAPKGDPLSGISFAN